MTAIRPSEYATFCVCTRCFDRLGQDVDDRLTCRACGASYYIRNGVLMLLPEYAEDERRPRYLASYERVARDDFVRPVEHDRESRNAVLLDFIGDVRGRRVLDIGFRPPLPRWSRALAARVRRAATWFRCRRSGT